MSWSDSKTKTVISCKSQFFNVAFQQMYVSKLIQGISTASSLKTRMKMFITCFKQILQRSKLKVFVDIC